MILNKDNDKNFTFTHEFDLIVLPTQIALNQGNLFLFLISTFLATKYDYVVLLVVWKHSLEVDGLWFTCMVPCYNHNVQRDLAQDQVTHSTGLVLIVRWTLYSTKQSLGYLWRNQVTGSSISHLVTISIRQFNCGPRSKHLMQLHELMYFKYAFEFKEPLFGNESE